MKKKYEKPNIEIVDFQFEGALMTGDIGDGDFEVTDSAASDW